MSEPPEPPLTHEQEAIAYADADQLTIVQAGAGTGKTHTLVSRIAFLAEESGLDPSDEILVVSFSRAAVNEVRRRLAEHPTSLPFVPVQTFDSYATAILDLIDPDGDWVDVGYDGRIRAATELISGEADGVHDVLTVRHLLIDEAQDLVGLRARFVGSILESTQAAFTVFTDAAQAIYGFSKGVRDRADLNEPFVDSLPRLAGTRHLARQSLTVQQRAASTDVTRVMQFGAVLADESLDVADLGAQLRELVESLPPAPDLTSLSRLLRRSTGRSTAILCRSNAQALLVSEELAQLGIEHRMQRTADDRAIGPWLASIAQQLDGHVLSRDQFDRIVSELSAIPVASPDDLWRGLRRMDPRGRTEIDLRRVASHLRHGNIPDELNEVTPASVVVSTIHRAKGLEFDRVVVVPAAYDEASDPAEENRVLYVGLSRAREDILVLTGYRSTGLRSDRRLGRVVEAGYPKGRTRATGLELLASDTQSATPVADSDRGVDAVKTQTYLLDRVAVGDPLRLELTKPRRDVGPSPSYAIVHGDTVIGETSEAFATVIASLVPAPKRDWPTVIKDARVQMVDTVAGEDSVARSAGLSRAGLWARVRLRGLGRFTTSGDTT